MFSWNISSADTSFNRRLAQRVVGAFTLPAWNKLVFCLAVYSASGLTVAANTQSTLHLQDAVKVVLLNDYGLKQMAHEQSAYGHLADAAGDLPDPILFSSIQNLPSDSFSFDQEAMTQLKIGLRQQFPKGRSRVLESSSQRVKAEQQERLMQARRFMLVKQTQQAWLEAWYWHAYQGLLAKDASFLTQLSDFVHSLYEVGKASQTEVLGVGLQQSKLKDTMLLAQRQYQNSRQSLNRLAHQGLAGEVNTDALPDIFAGTGTGTGAGAVTADATQVRVSDFYAHPEVSSLEVGAQIAEHEVQLAEQHFKPAWAMELSYGLRDGENMDGSNRSDLLSAGLSVQLPLFSDDKHHAHKRAALSKQRQANARRDEAASRLLHEYVDLNEQLKFIAKQRLVYQQEILRTLEKQKATALDAYQSDKGDFGNLVQLYLNDQAAQAQYLRLQVDEQKLKSSMAYLSASTTETQQ